MASLAGVPVPESYGLEGQDLSPALAQVAQQRLQGRGISGGSAAVEDVSNWSTSSAAAGLRNFTLSVYPRCPADVTNSSNFWKHNDCTFTERTEFPFFGISIRTETFRYTEWRAWNGSQLAPVLGSSDEKQQQQQQQEGAVVTGAAGRGANPALIAVELYDHTGDDGNSFDGAYEVVNLAGNPSYASQQAQLAALLRSSYPTWA